MVFSMSGEFSTEQPQMMRARFEIFPPTSAAAFSASLTVMKDGGVALIGLGESESATDRVTEAVTEALTSPLLGSVELKDATGALVRVIGGPTMTVSEAEKAAALVGGKISKRARIIWGCSVENTPELENTIKVLLIITGVRATSLLGQKGGYAAGESEEVIDLVR